jgi:hypothetical protein
MIRGQLRASCAAGRGRGGIIAAEKVCSLVDRSADVLLYLNGSASLSGLSV